MDTFVSENVDDKLSCVHISVKHAGTLRHKNTVSLLEHLYVSHIFNKKLDKCRNKTKLVQGLNQDNISCKRSFKMFLCKTYRYMETQENHCFPSALYTAHF